MGAPKNFLLDKIFYRRVIIYMTGDRPTPKDMKKNISLKLTIVNLVPVLLGMLEK